MKRRVIAQRDRGLPASPASRSRLFPRPRARAMGGSEEPGRPGPAAAPGAPPWRVIGGGLSDRLDPHPAPLPGLPLHPGGVLGAAAPVVLRPRATQDARGLLLRGCAALQHSEIAFDAADARLAVDLSQNFSTLPTATGAGEAWLDPEQLHMAGPVNSHLCAGVSSQACPGRQAASCARICTAC